MATTGTMEDVVASTDKTKWMAATNPLVALLAIEPKASCQPRTESPVVVGGNVNTNSEHNFENFLFNCFTGPDGMGYTTMYQNNQKPDQSPHNKNHLTWHEWQFGDETKNSDPKTSGIKTHWKGVEIEKFVKDVLSSCYGYDSLILIISATFKNKHQKEFIYDSYGREFALSDIYKAIGKEIGQGKRMQNKPVLILHNMLLRQPEVQPAQEVQPEAGTVGGVAAFSAVAKYLYSMLTLGMGGSASNGKTTTNAGGEKHLFYFVFNENVLQGLEKSIASVCESRDLRESLIRFESFLHRMDSHCGRASSVWPKLDENECILFLKKRRIFYETNLKSDTALIPRYKARRPLVILLLVGQYMTQKFDKSDKKQNDENNINISAIDSDHPDAIDMQETFGIDSIDELNQRLREVTNQDYKDLIDAFWKIREWDVLYRNRENRSVRLTGGDAAPHRMVKNNYKINCTHEDTDSFIGEIETLLKRNENSNDCIIVIKSGLATVNTNIQLSQQQHVPALPQEKEELVICDSALERIDFVFNEIDPNTPKLIFENKLIHPNLLQKYKPPPMTVMFDNSCFEHVCNLFDHNEKFVRDRDLYQILLKVNQLHTNFDDSSISYNDTLLISDQSNRFLDNPLIRKESETSQEMSESSIKSEICESKQETKENGDKIEKSSQQVQQRKNYNYLKNPLFMLMFSDDANHKYYDRFIHHFTKVYNYRVLYKNDKGENKYFHPKQSDAMTDMVSGYWKWPALSVTDHKNSQDIQHVQSFAQHAAEIVKNNDHAGVIILCDFNFYETVSEFFNLSDLQQIPKIYFSPRLSFQVRSQSYASLNGRHVENVNENTRLLATTDVNNVELGNECVVTCHSKTSLIINKNTSELEYGPKNAFVPRIAAVFNDKHRGDEPLHKLLKQIKNYKPPPPKVIEVATNSSSMFSAPLGWNNHFSLLQSFWASKAADSNEKAHVKHASKHVATDSTNESLDSKESFSEDLEAKDCSDNIFVNHNCLPFGVDFNFGDDSNFASLKQRSRARTLSLKLKEFPVKNALVAMIGIGQYSDLSDLKGIDKDYQRMVDVFVSHWRYHFLYQTSDQTSGAVRVLSHEELAKNKGKYRQNWKTKWTFEQMQDFVDAVRENVNQTKPDALIFIIAGHGDSEGIVYDSHSAEFQLSYLYYIFSNRKDGCPHLADKPKFVVVEACRGQQTPVPTAKRKDHQLHSRSLSKAHDMEINNILEQTVSPKGREKLGQDWDEKEIKEVKDEVRSLAYDLGGSQALGWIATVPNIPGISSSPYAFVSASSSASASDSGESGQGLESLDAIGCALNEDRLDSEAFCKIFANLDDYGVVDTPEGGYMLMAIDKVLRRDEASEIAHTDLIGLIRRETQRLVGNGLVSPRVTRANNIVRMIVESHDNIEGRVLFKKRNVRRWGGFYIY